MVGQLRRIDLLAPDLVLKRVDRFGRAPGQQHLALVHDRHRRAQVSHVLDDVGGQDHRHVLADCRQQVEESVTLLRVEAGGGFIDDHQPRVAQQRLGNAEALAHAAGERAELALARIPQVHLLQQPIDHFAALRTLGQPLEYGEMLQQVQRADLWIHAKILRQVAQPAAHGVLVAQHVDRRFAGDAERGRTTVGLLQGGQCAHQRGLARAVRADQRVQFARRDIQRHPVGRGKPAEAAHQFAGSQRGGRGHRSGRHTDASLTSALLAWAFWAGACPAGHRPARERP
ncbi:hypothetical protein G6F40_013492 [Rhizopus arrhizus]|nr:hypothetical protein G6F40_013492 [Rhizopus arrhizus]